MRIFILLLIVVTFQAKAQYMKIYTNGGCIMMVDSANTIKTCDKEFRFQTNESLSTVTISTNNRIFSNYKYTGIKKADGTNLASSFSDLMVKLGDIQSSVLNNVNVTPSNVSYSCIPVTSTTIYAAGTYKEICISPVNYGTYTLQTGSNTANTGLFNITTLKNESGGFISNITTVTPTGSSTLTICTKQ